MRHLVSPIACLTLICSAPTWASAQTSPQAPTVNQDVVVTASAGPVPIESVSRTVVVLTREDLERLAITSFAGALRLAPGVDPRARGPRDVQTDFSIRGATFGQSLVLIDGFRLNDSQSGHHNGEIPTPLVAIDRLEVVNGAGSAVHGADALGGTINVISRRDAHVAGSLSGGQFGYVSGEVSASGIGVPDDWLLTGWANRSGGFAFDRGFAQGGAAIRGTPGRHLAIAVRHQRKAFGANGFYGPSPSKEWTDQTLATTTVQAITDRWTLELRGAYRRHGDHFRWDIGRPGFAENRHRTHAAEGAFIAQRGLSGGQRLTFGGGAGGDWIASSNLGDWRYGRVHAFAEAHAPLADRVVAQAGVRFDSYSSFGHAVSPSASMSAWVTPRLRLRASAGRAFRIPTFTELYYTDPNHAASADLVPERGWSLDGGADWTAGGWTISASPFVRWDRDLIDWVRQRATDRWRTTNVRDVTAAGIEASLTRRWREGFVRARYVGTRVDAPELDLLSKYVREYVPHAVGWSLSTAVFRNVRLGLDVDHRKRLLSGASDISTLVGARLGRTLGRAHVFVEATNLFDEDYVEVAGVEMPGRWVTVGVAIR